MPAIQTNQELLQDNPYFSTAARLDEAAAYFGFDRRRVILGNGALTLLGEECRRLEAKRVLVVRDAGIAALEAPLRAALDGAGIGIAGVFDRTQPNPTVESVTELARVLGQTDCRAVVALGGGSTLDAAKAAACLATSGGALPDYFGFDLFPAPARWPLIAVPTTSGTGSEASRVAVVADERGKQAIYSDHLTPDVALVDPQLMRDLPAPLTAVSGLDALGHALECTASKKSNPLGDAVARASLGAGAPHLVRAIENGPQDPEARYGMARCALLAGLLLSPINTGAAHALGYGIEKRSAAAGRPVPHGAAVALVLPGVMRHNAAAVAEKYYYAAGVAGLDLGGRSREAGAEEAARWIDRLRRERTPFASLRAAGLEADEIGPMVEISMGIRRLLDPNPVELSDADAEAIYRAVLD